MIDFTYQPDASLVSNLKGAARLDGLYNYVGLITSNHAFHAVQGSWIAVPQYTQEEAQANKPDEGVAIKRVPQPVGSDVDLQQDPGNFYAGGVDSLFNLKIPDTQPLYLETEVRQYQSGVGSLKSVGQPDQQGAAVISQGIRPDAFTNVNVAQTLAAWDQEMATSGDVRLAYRAILAGPGKALALNVEDLVNQVEKKAVPNLKELMAKAVPGALKT